MADNTSKGVSLGELREVAQWLDKQSSGLAPYVSLASRLVRAAADEIEAARSTRETKANSSFQARVVAWAVECFGRDDVVDRDMRTDRFLEEALELVQACGCPADRAERVLRYVYSRPAGEVPQETGGTMVSLAVLCQAFAIGMDRCAEAELTRVLGKIEHIRARHAAKPDFALKT